MTYAEFIRAAIRPAKRRSAQKTMIIFRSAEDFPNVFEKLYIGSSRRKATPVMSKVGSLSLSQAIGIIGSHSAAFC
jgi:hypothetical protein